MSLEKSIDAVHLLLSSFIEEKISSQQSESSSIDLASVLSGNDLERTDRFRNELSTNIFESLKPEFSADVAGDTSEETKKAALAFNGSVGQQSKEFVLLMGFTKYCDEKLHKIRRLNQATQADDMSVDSSPIVGEEPLLIQHICVVFDLLMSMASDEAFASVKTIFYSLLSHVSDTLASVSTSSIHSFWGYVESRSQRMKDTVFSPEVTSNRIGILSVCNNLTDKLYGRQKDGKLDSYAKDTFNDVFHARVRTFLAKMLNFDDSTGLNKYFALANRANREPRLRKINTGDDQLLDDVLSFQKLLRDPYWYLKNPRQLATQTDSLVKLHAYLLEEEAKYSKIHPIRNIYAVKEPWSDETRHALESKYADMEFFPEEYWLSPFEDAQSGSRFEESRAQDQVRALKRFDSSKFRQLLILQIYLVSCFFVELGANHKRQTLKKIGALPTTKHITEDATPESLVSRFSKIKRDTVHSVKPWDTQWSFSLHGLAVSEENWWAWLIYGKSKDGKPLLAASPLSDAEIAATESKHKDAYPEKTKRYFNSHATPQLSRRMKTPTGLHLLKGKGRAEHSYSEEIAELTGRIEAESDRETRAELVEERTVLLWKQVRAARSKSWFSLDSQLSAADLEIEKEEEKEEEKEKEEKEEKEKDKEEEGKEEEETEEKKETTEDEEKGKSENEEKKAEGSEKDADQKSEDSKTENKDSDSKSEDLNDKEKNLEQDSKNGVLQTPAAGESSVGELTGDHIAETRVAQTTDQTQSVGETAGQTVAETRKRARAPEDDAERENGGEPESAKRLKTGSVETES